MRTASAVVAAVLGTTLAALAGAGVASAQDGCEIDPFNCATLTPTVGGAIPGDAAGRRLGVRRRTRVTPETIGRGRRSAPRRTARRGRRGVGVGRTRTCTTFRRGRAVRVCVKRGAGAPRCRKPRPSRRARAGAATSQRQGFMPQNIPQVGKIWKNGLSHCTGTLVTRGIIVTAAHCLYVNAEVARQSGGTLPLGYVLDQGDVLEFAPNNAWNGADAALPVYFAAETAYMPHNVWRIVRTWVPQCFADNNMQCDFALAELQPAADGTYIGDTLGSWPLRTELQIPLGAHFYSVGYSASGVFTQYTNGYGNAQYFCDVSWQGEYLSDAFVTSGGFNLASDDAGRTANTFAGCQHMGGASGGPVFLELSDGSWVVNGVNSSGPSNGQWGFAISWNYLGPEMTALYCFVVGCGTASSASAGPPPVAGRPGRAARGAIRTPAAG